MVSIRNFMNYSVVIFHSVVGPEDYSIVGDNFCCSRCSVGS